jgi:hypothetical protein
MFNLLFTTALSISFWMLPSKAGCCFCLYIVDSNFLYVFQKKIRYEPAFCKLIEFIFSALFSLLSFQIQFAFYIYIHHTPSSKITLPSDWIPPTFYFRKVLCKEIRRFSLLFERKFSRM